MIKLTKGFEEVVLDNPSIFIIESYVKRGYTIKEYIIRGETDAKEKGKKCR